MAMQHLWDVQVGVFQAAKTACDALAPPVEVRDHIPVDMPAEYVRLDGFEMAGDLYKNTLRNRHEFVIHYFAATREGEDATHGNKRSFAVMAAIDAALRDAPPMGWTLHLDGFDQGDDRHVAENHAFARYVLYA